MPAPYLSLMASTTRLAVAKSAVLSSRRIWLPLPRVERAVASTLGEGNQIRLELNTADFATASRVVEAINDKYGAGIAYALDGRVIRVQAPSSSDQRTLQMKRDLPGISQKVLTQQLRELVADRLVDRIDFNEKPLRVEYRLAPRGRELMPVLIAARAFSVSHGAGDTAI